MTHAARQALIAAAYGLSLAVGAFVREAIRMRPSEVRSE